MTATGLSAANGTVPVNRRNRVQASEYWSLRWSSGAPESCSGEAKARVAVKVPVRVRWPVSSRNRAMPKSVRYTRSPTPGSARSSRMFAGFTSRCSTPRACAKSSALAVSPTICTARHGGSVATSSAAASVPSM
ncbi:Uncharacterised protein [Mycobacteroides abscessus subsp. abscessus]|nr:Uncharacterised protein [Mycobacteroides abscessus subsp. abscessus]